MKGTLTHTLTLTFLLFYLLSIGAQALMVAEPRLPDLTVSAAIVAEGTVAIRQDEAYLIPSKFLKGGTSGDILLGSREYGFVQKAKFQEGERVLLFLDSPDEAGRAFLYSLGDMGKWPKPTRLDTYGRANLSRLVTVVGAIVQALSRSSFEERAKDIIAMLQSQDDVMQLAGLDLARSRALSDSLPPKQRNSAESQLAAFAIPLLQSPNRDVRGTTVLLMKSPPNIVSAPLLIPLITDPDIWVRRQVRVALGRVVADAKIQDAEIISWLKRPCDLSQAEDPDAADIQQLMEQLWSEKREVRLQKELPRIRKGLDSASQTEREAARVFMDLLETSN